MNGISGGSAYTPSISRSLNTSFEKLASGSKINRASDDPAGLAISETLRAVAAGSEMAVENIDNALDFTDTANGYIQSANDISGRLRELSIQNGNPLLSQENKDALQSEFDALQGQLTESINNAQYNGQDVFTAAPQDLTVNAEGETVAIEGLDATNTEAAIAALDINDVSSVSALTDALTTQAGEIGASESQLLATKSGLENYTANLQEAQSRVRDTDIAKEMINFSTQQIRSQAATALQGQANAFQGNVLSLLS